MSTPHYFPYGETEMDFLRKVDAKMKYLVDALGYIKREVDPDFFQAAVHQIAGQQISMKALDNLWSKIKENYNPLTPKTVLDGGAEKLQGLGLSRMKVTYIYELAAKIESGEFKPEEVRKTSDEEAIKEMIKLRGFGIWTAEMILIFCFERKNVFSYDDYAMVKGLKMTYGFKTFSRRRYNSFKKKFSPYCTIASLYFWEVAGNKVPGIENLREKTHD